MKFLLNGLKTFSLLIAATLIAYIYVHFTAMHTNVAITYILAVFLIARFTSGYFWGIVASIIGVVGVNYFFTYPFFQINFTLDGYPFTFLSLLTISVVTSTMTAHITERNKVISEREEMTHRLNLINNQLLISDHIDQIIELALETIVDFTNSSAIFHKTNPLKEKNYIEKLYSSEDREMFITAHELEKAHWAFVKSTPPSLTESDIAYGSSIYLPVISHEHIWGVIGIYNFQTALYHNNTLTFLNLMLTQIAMAIERQHLVDQHHHLALETEKEKMRANLLRAVSHDLRTPLTGIIGAGSTYLENKAYLTENEKDDLVKHILEDANWLIHMVENLLSITRIKEGQVKVNKTLEPLEEVVSEAISRLKKRYPQSQILVKVPDTFLMIPMDATLIEQVILNLLENSLKYAHSTAPIELLVVENIDYITFKIIDHGIGLSPEQLDGIFDGNALNPKAKSDSSKGMGIGLSICKTIICAHGGEISAQNHIHGGAEFIFTLPTQGGTIHEQNIYTDC